MDCINYIKSDMSNIVLSPTCQRLPASGNVFKCCTGSYIIKLFYKSDPDDVRKFHKELAVFDKLDHIDPQLRSFFCQRPEIFEDELGFAYIYPTNEHIFTLHTLQFSTIEDNPCVQQLQSIINRAVEMLTILNANGIYHGDAHNGNIIYNCQTDTVQFIDVELTKILPADAGNKFLNKAILEDKNSIEELLLHN